MKSKQIFEDEQKLFTEITQGDVSCVIQKNVFRFEITTINEFKNAYEKVKTPITGRRR